MLSFLLYLLKHLVANLRPTAERDIGKLPAASLGGPGLGC